MLTEIIATFEAQSAAVAAFKSFAVACADLARKDANNAALLLGLAVMARQYVDDFEGQPMSLADVAAGRNALLREARAVKETFGASPEARLAAANNVASAYFAMHP